MYSYDSYSSRYSNHHRHSLADTCSDTLGEATAMAVTGITMVLQLPFVAVAFILGEVTDSFIRASENVGEAVGREAGRFVGRVVGGGAEALATTLSRGGSALFDAATDAFTAASSRIRWPF